MSFHATNYTVSIALLMALTVFTAGVRMRKPLENNWPFLYWIFVTVISFRYPDETFDPRIIMIGLAAGLLLRFEFLNPAVGNLLKLVEVCVWAYIMYMGFVIVTTT
jgi:hypothetical protein